MLGLSRIPRVVSTLRTYGTSISRSSLAPSHFPLYENDCVTDTHGFPLSPERRLYKSATNSSHLKVEITDQNGFPFTTSQTERIDLVDTNGFPLEGSSTILVDTEKEIVATSECVITDTYGFPV